MEIVISTHENTYTPKESNSKWKTNFKSRSKSPTINKKFFTSMPF